MASNMDRSLDEILAEKRKDRPRNNNNNRRGGGGGGRGGDSDRPPRQRNERTEYPRDGIRKSYRDDSRNLDSEWVHDRYEDDNRPRRSEPRRGRRESPEIDSTTAKLRVENLHYELTEDDLDGLFNKIGPVTRLVLVYDRAGRSEGVAYVTYEDPQDAREAIREFDGANANGQPIRLSLVPNGGRGRGGGRGGNRNPFDTAVMPGRPLSERVSAPRGRSRSPGRNQDYDDAADRGIDRYVPGGRNRSPLPRRRGGGRRPGARHETGGGRGQQNEGGRGGGGGGNRRPKKTQEELDAEMANYFTGNNGDAPADANGTTTANATSAPAGNDIDMIE